MHAVSVRCKLYDMKHYASESIYYGAKLFRKKYRLQYGVRQSMFCCWEEDSLVCVGVSIILTEYKLSAFTFTVHTCNDKHAPIVNIHVHIHPVLVSDKHAAHTLNAAAQYYNKWKPVYGPPGFKASGDALSPPLISFRIFIQRAIWISLFNSSSHLLEPNILLHGQIYPIKSLPWIFGWPTPRWSLDCNEKKSITYQYHKVIEWKMDNPVANTE